MSHEFKLKYDELKDNDPSSKEEEKNYFAPSSTRNVCFVQTDGKMLFLNYAYLVSGEYLPEDNTIILCFTSHTITLSGVSLASLFKEFLDHIPRTVQCTDDRYNTLDEENSSVINKIEILKNSE